MLPNFLVIGAPRSGTTWIEKNLRAHPDVFMPSRKELHFFDRDYARGLTYYEDLFSGWSGQAAVGEASPSYLAGRDDAVDIARRIAENLPGVRLIASLRNPIDRVYSRFLNAKAKFDENAALSLEDKLREKPEFLREGIYADHLQRYYEVFPREQVLVLLYDDLIANGHAFMKRVYTFLSVDANFTTGLEEVRVNAAAGKRNLARSKSLWLLGRAIGRLGARRLADRLRTANSRELPQMSPETRQLLLEMYRPHNERLEKLIDRDLSAWSRT